MNNPTLHGDVAPTGGGSLQSSRLEEMRAQAPALHNGAYTISHPAKPGAHFTVKVWTVQKGDLAGKRVVGLLTGPDNVNDFRGVAFWDDDKRCAFIWKRFKGHNSRNPLDGYHFQEETPGWSEWEKKVAIFVDLAIRHLLHGRGSRWHANGWKIQRSSRCVRCNRELTHPESIDLGIGPECATRAGGRR